MVAEEQRLPWQLQNVTSSEMKRVAWPPPAPSTKPATETNEELEFTARESNQEVSSSSEVSQLTQVSQVIEGTVPVVADSQSPSYSSVISHQKEGENQENEMVDAADAFASNELVGERKIIDKPALPAGFLLQPFKLKEEAPITQKPHDIITSEPIFKQATPLRKLGDMVWPPKSGSSNNGEVVMSQDAIPSRRQQKNYQSFFGQHQLNASFPMYRAPPGTQHFGLEEGENATPM